ncbi:hypothetical protein [Thalassomonas sp. M1454]|uniref:hypothetical protein n=1 Tax=Thalassomonas sp. M1454 TaxID=2594477 RepID=UPI0011813B1B|nr:hypothetical protein [Thalassomonas sp. M1454]TRX56737.1 hypothetical protein FNN08_04195 [Thalassomonas sp. M1454]
MKKNNKLKLLTPIASALLLVACGGSSSSGPEVNTAPVLNIENLNAVESQIVSLKANATDDSSGLSYAWSVPTVEGLELLETNTDTLLFKAPSVTEDKLDINVSLTVTDSGGLSATESAIITINNDIPVVSISGPENTFEKETVSLDFEISGANEILNFEWAFEGVNVNLQEKSINSKNIQNVNRASTEIGSSYKVVGGSTDIDILSIAKPTNLIATLTATDMDGDVATYSKTILVNNIFEEVTLTGLVTDAPIANADVTIFIGMREVKVKADSNGQYIAYLEVDDDEMTSLVKIAGTGVGEQGGTELVSLIGSVGELIEASKEGNEFLSDNNFELNVTNITTAEYALILDANKGVEPTTSEDFNKLSAEVDPSEVIKLATFIKIAIDFPESELPEGIESTLDLVTSADALNEFKQDFPEDSDIYTDALAEIIADPMLIKPQEIAVPNILYTSAIPSNFNAESSQTWLFNDGTGAYNNKTFTYTVDGNVISGQFSENEATLSYRIVNTADGTFEVEQRTNFNSFEMILLSKSDNIITYMYEITSTKSHLQEDVDNYGIEAEIVSTWYEIETAITQEEIDNFPDMNGKTAVLPIAEYYKKIYHEGYSYYPSSKLVNDDKFVFYSNGTGRLDYLDVEFTWLIEGTSLNINYEEDVNGFVNASYTLFDKEGLLDKVYFNYSTSLGEFGSKYHGTTGDAKIFETNKPLEWASNDIAGIYIYPHSEQTRLDFFWFELDENGNANTLSTSDDNLDGLITRDEVYFQYGTWRIEDGKLKITRLRSINGYNPDIEQRTENEEYKIYHERTWDLINKQGNNFTIMNTHNFMWGNLYQDEYTSPNQEDVYIDYRVMQKIDIAPVEIHKELSSKSLGSKKFDISKQTVITNQYSKDVNLK